MKKQIHTLLAAAVMLCANFMLSIPAFAQPGELDPSFGTGGKVITDLGSDSETARSVAIQSDGKIIVAGYSGTEPNGDFALARYLADGTPDEDFGTGGIVTTDIFLGDDSGYSIAIQSDDKIVVSGYTSNVIGVDIALVRYNTDGTLDETFDDDGIVVTDLKSLEDIGYAVLIQEDDKILVGGFTFTSSLEDFVLLRYNIDGSLDNTFGGDGIVVTDFDERYDIGTCIALNGSKIIVGGFNSNGTNEDFAIARYLSDGSLDNSFGGDGLVVTDFDDTEQDINAIAVQSTGKIIVGGYSFTDFGENEDFAIARYQDNGSLDGSFGDGGIVVTDFDGNYNKILSVTIQDDDKIIVVGYADNGSENDFAMARYKNDGSLDESFGDGGIVITDFDTRDDKANSVKLQDDNKIVVCGRSIDGSNSDFALARYQGDIDINIEDNMSDPSLQIFPNPFISGFNISSVIGSELVLFDILGNEILKQQISGGDNTVYVTSLPPGIYLVSWSDGERRIEQVVVKE